IELAGRDAYTVQNGTVFIKPAILEKLSVGKHTVIIKSEKGYAETIVTVEGKAVQPAEPGNPNSNEQSPQTGASSELEVWFAVLMVCAGCMGTALLYRRRKQKAGQ
ncbi:MAG: hypothetical protein ACLRVT_09530, partial [Oscillospiraceae bacterium]